MLLFPAFTIYSVVEKYVTINNKENTASIMFWITFPYFDSYYSVWLSLEDNSGSFKIKRLPKKRAISWKTKVMVPFTYSSCILVYLLYNYYDITAALEPRRYLAWIHLLSALLNVFNVNFLFSSITFQKQNLVQQIYIMVTDINSPKRCSKNIWYSGSFKFGFFDILIEDDLIACSENSIFHWYSITRHP